MLEARTIAMAHCSKIENIEGENHLEETDSVSLETTVLPSFPVTRVSRRPIQPMSVHYQCTITQPRVQGRSNAACKKKIQERVG
ncbi:hypothetical protein E2C01_005854 [Portunus trituberculatus]|uniref:Uncharacterized protein n=1 Tax=Portunus trituberculatus TaxID=210409 RepID=A0A5B7CWK0_PORTR|nr:hypothetical protein [Portunus trituberculatus]